VLKKAHKRWLWTVRCRRTRQIGAFLPGDRSRQTCQRCGTASRPRSGLAPCTLIFGTPINMSCQPLSIMRWAKRLVKRIIWNVGTRPYAKECRAMYARPSQFRSPKPIITCLRSGSSMITISPSRSDHHLFSNHYPK